MANSIYMLIRRPQRTWIE